MDKIGGLGLLMSAMVEKNALTENDIAELSRTFWRKRGGTNLWKEILLTSSVLILALLLFAAAVPKNPSPAGAVRPVGAGGAAAAGAGQPARPWSTNVPDCGGAEPVTARITAPGPVCDPHLPEETIASAPPGGSSRPPPPSQAFRVDTATGTSTVDVLPTGKNVTHSIEYKSQIPLTPVSEKPSWLTGCMGHGGDWVSCLRTVRFFFMLRPPPEAGNLTRGWGRGAWTLPIRVYLTADLALPLSVRPVFTPPST